MSKHPVIWEARARSYAVQAMYQWQFNPQDEDQIIAEYLLEHRQKKFKQAYFKQLFKGTLAHLEQIDTIIQSVIDRPFEQIDEISRAILRIATYEMIKQNYPHAKIIILAAIKLASVFGPENSPRYVDGILNRIAQKYRG